MIKKWMGLLGLLSSSMIWADNLKPWERKWAGVIDERGSVMPIYNNHDVISMIMLVVVAAFIGLYVFSKQQYQGQQRLSSIVVLLGLTVFQLFSGLGYFSDLATNKPFFTVFVVAFFFCLPSLLHGWAVFGLFNHNIYHGNAIRQYQYFAGGALLVNLIGLLALPKAFLTMQCMAIIWYVGWLVYVSFNGNLKEIYENQDNENEPQRLSADEINYLRDELKTLTAKKLDLGLSDDDVFTIKSYIEELANIINMDQQAAKLHQSFQNLLLKELGLFDNPPNEKDLIRHYLDLHRLINEPQDDDFHIDYGFAPPIIANLVDKYIKHTQQHQQKPEILYMQSMDFLSALINDCRNDENPFYIKDECAYFLSSRIEFHQDCDNLSFQ